MADNEGTLLSQVAFLNKPEGGIPISVSLPQIKPGVWQASAEIACSHPGVMWAGPERRSAAEAHTDRVSYVEEALAEGGVSAGGTLDYAPVDQLPSLWVDASVARMMLL